eukprot:scaffold7116_cov296-Pinguiococcus_pyrenoidosus.AAC.18
MRGGHADVVAHHACLGRDLVARDQDAVLHPKEHIPALLALDGDLRSEHRLRTRRARRHPILEALSGRVPLSPRKQPYAPFRLFRLRRVPGFLGRGIRRLPVFVVLGVLLVVIEVVFVEVEEILLVVGLLVIPDAWLDVLPNDLDAEGDEVLLGNLPLALHEGAGRELDPGKHVRHVQALVSLRVRHAGQALLLIVWQVEVVLEGLDLVPLAREDMGHLRSGEVRQLQERRLHRAGRRRPQALGDALGELDRRTRRLPPSPGRADLHHGVDEVRGAHQHLLQISQKQRTGELLALQVRVQEHDALLHHGELPRRELVLKSQLLGLLELRLGQHAHLCCPRGLDGVDRPILLRDRQHFRQHFHGDLLVQGAIEPMVRVEHDHLLPVALGLRVPAADNQGDDDHQRHEVHHKDERVVVLVDEPGRQAHAELQALLAVRVAILLPVLLRHGIRERAVGLRDQHEHLLRLLVARVLVRVVDQRHLAVGLLDLRLGGSRVHSEDGKGVELLDLGVVAHQNGQVHQEHPQQHGADGQAGEERGCHTVSRGLLRDLPRLLRLRLRPGREAGGQPIPRRCVGLQAADHLQVMVVRGASFGESVRGFSASMLPRRT